MYIGYMYICLYIHIHIYVNIHIYIHIWYIYTCIKMYVCTCILLTQRRLAGHCTKIYFSWKKTTRKWCFFQNFNAQDKVLSPAHLIVTIKDARIVFFQKKCSDRFFPKKAGHCTKIYFFWKKTIALDCHHRRCSDLDLLSLPPLSLHQCRCQCRLERC